MAAKTRSTSPQGWLMFLPQVPAELSALRVRVWRRLQGLGAVGLKSGAQLLPDTPACLEALQWLAGELSEAGCEATIARCEFVHGIDDAGLRQRFNAERDAEYAALVDEIERSRGQEGGTATLERQLGRIRARDYFAAPKASEAEAALRARAVAASTHASTSRRGLPASGTVWVTRRGVKVDRIASAWLIQRFIDAKARFRFVAPEQTRRRRGEVGFDMVQGEYSHRDGLCTFEVLLDELGSDDAALRKLAEMVHELDLSDDRYQHAETAGLNLLIRGVIDSVADDGGRIERGGQLLDGLYAGLKAKTRPG